MNRYSICWMQICPFERLKGGILKPNLDEYPYRLCVFDKESNLVIDVKSEKSYEYIFTSLVYFHNQDAKKIIDNRRYAIMKLRLSIFEVDSNDYKHAYKILEDMCNGKDYIDGNIISNEDYLNQINGENVNNVKVMNK